MPSGNRPLRTVCGMDFGANDLNGRIAPVQADVLRALGMEQMIPAFASDFWDEGSKETSAHRNFYGGA